MIDESEENKVIKIEQPSIFQDSDERIVPLEGGNMLLYCLKKRIVIEKTYQIDFLYTVTNKINTDDNMDMEAHVQIDEKDGISMFYKKTFYICEPWNQQTLNQLIERVVQSKRLYIITCIIHKQLIRSVNDYKLKDNKIHKRQEFYKSLKEKIDEISKLIDCQGVQIEMYHKYIQSKQIIFQIQNGQPPTLASQLQNLSIESMDIE